MCSPDFYNKGETVWFEGAIFIGSSIFFLVVRNDWIQYRRSADSIIE